MKIDPAKRPAVGPTRPPALDPPASGRGLRDVVEIARRPDYLSSILNPAPRIPMAGNVMHPRPPFTRIAEDMGDLLMPLSCFGLTAATLTQLNKYLAGKADVLPVDVVSDEQGHPRRIGALGTNPLFLCRMPDGTRGVFKSMEPQSESWVTRMKEESAREIVASAMMKAFGVHSISYRAAVARVDGDEHEGVVSEFVDHRTLLHDPSTIEKIADPDAAIRGSVIDAWMGNFDRIINDGNVWVQPDGRMVFGDYGCTFRRGLTALGVPKVNQRLFERYATAANVEPVVDEIRNLSDRDIKRMVERASASAPTITLSQRRHIEQVLMANRDELRACNPFAPYYSPGHAAPLAFPLDERVGRTIARRAVLRFGGDGAPAEVVAFRVASQLRGYEPRHGQDVRVVADTLAGLIRLEKGGDATCAIMRPADFIAWQQVCKLLLTSETSLGLHLGLQ